MAKRVRLTLVWLFSHTTPDNRCMMPRFTSLAAL